jgi:hypothetical protein
MSAELLQHDRRITRLEAQWDTALQLAAPKGTRRLASKAADGGITHSG